MAGTVTLGELARRGIALSAWCESCGRYREPPLALLIAKLGAATPITAVGRRMRCAACGARRTQVRPRYPSLGVVAHHRRGGVLQRGVDALSDSANADHAGLREARMLQDIPGLDHLVLGARDLGAVGARFERMGFTLTPRAEHPFGTANQLAILDGNFIELLGVAAPERFPSASAERYSLGAHLDDFLARREGLAFVVLSSSDARADHRRFREAGLDTYEPVDFSRAAAQPGGGEATVSFSIVFALPPEAADAPHFVCQQHTPEYFWHGEYQAHPNGARGITEVVLVADRPADLTPYYVALVAPNAVHGEGRRLLVETGRGRIVVLPPEEIEARFPGLDVPVPAARPAIVAMTLACADLARVAGCLDGGAVAYARVEDCLRVGPEAAFGAVVEFRLED